ncbi:MAG: hypothetical protein O7A08_06500 [SAR324 cluster bacterium]|nr:hypothetical protein [SAR324 cluster bacterium]MCZ6558836.1 hypothetical protein [SAR324 cluster bacterium]MCZ6645209.1 hypothetical protein [SAR324 cluster bacterium]MCZ6728929.1 hypothetical protein [SAR324 cluster bacterium]MCZ6843929.1 hypothetical protein [SAR324 cluster bacterium]
MLYKRGMTGVRPLLGGLGEWKARGLPVAAHTPSGAAAPGAP